MQSSVLTAISAAAVLGAGVLGACASDSAPSTFSEDDAGADVSVDGADDGPAFANVTVVPNAVTLKVPLGGTATQVYTARADVGAQKQVDVTNQCVWSVSDTSFGSFAGATFTASPRGGASTVTAGCGRAYGKSDLTLVLTGSLVLPGAPANAPALFAAAQPGNDPTHTPGVEYPIDQAVAPLNIPPIDAQWTTGQNDLFHLTYASPHATLEVYTTQADAAFDPPTWSTVATSTSGDAIEITVEGLVQATPTTKYKSAPITLKMSADQIDKTSIYYWASSQGSLMTQTFGATTAPTAIHADCTSCHSLSRSGTRIGYDRCVGGDCNQIFVGFMRYDAKNKVWTDTMNANDKAFRGSYSTFAPVGNPFPDDATSVSLVARDTCNLSLFDPDLGKPVASNVDAVSTHDNGQPGRCATMPDWSPDGQTVVFASTPHQGQYIDVSDSAIATMTYSFAGGAHTFGEPQFLVRQPITLPNGTYNSFFFPSFSPDGALIIFDAARGPWRNFGTAAAAGQRLMLTNKTGAWTVDLAKLNGSGDLDVTWPHWAPTASTDYYWVVFSSERDYGHKLTAANTAPACVANGVKQCKQLWLAAIDKRKLGAGTPPAEDPSAPPVWIPGQDIGADNISPYWTLPPDVAPK